MMQIAKNVQIIVLGVNIDSFSNHQVRNGKISQEVPKAINLTAQADSSNIPYVILLAKYAQRVVGIASIIAINRLLSFIALSINCVLVVNQTMM